MSCPVCRISLYVTEQYSGLVDGMARPGVDWLAGVLLPKVLQWAQESSVGGKKGELRQTLVPLDRYGRLYQQMKERYGHTLIKVHRRVVPPN